MFYAEDTVAPYRYRQGSSALIVSMPHAGTFVPPSIGRTLADCAAQRSDTDWHLPRLYDFLDALDATVIVANYSRYVVDVNRPPDGANLYPGRDTPRLCPVDTFARRPLYRSGEPSAAEVERRVAALWTPYHRRLAREIERVRAAHRVAIVWDAHSIVSTCPRLFDGRLADFNLGTADGATCDPALAGELVAALRRHAPRTVVLDGRFKGGYITRLRPRAQACTRSAPRWRRRYMDETPPYTFRESLAAPIRSILRAARDRFALGGQPGSRLGRLGGVTPT